MTVESFLSSIAAALAADTARLPPGRGEAQQEPVILVRGRDERGFTYFFGCVAAAGRKELSQREVEVALQLTWDRSVKQIVHDLRISEGTVKTFKQRIQQKTGLRGRAALALYAFHAYSPCPVSLQRSASAQDLSPGSHG